MNTRLLRILAAVTFLVLGGCMLAEYEGGGFYHGTNTAYIGSYPYGRDFAYFYHSYPGYYSRYPFAPFYRTYPVFIDKRAHSWHGPKDGIVKKPHGWHGRKDWIGKKGDGWHDRKDDITGKPGGDWPDRKFNRDGRSDRGERLKRTPTLKCSGMRC